MLQVNTCLGESRGPGGVQPKGGIIFAGALRLQFRRGIVDPVFEMNSVMPVGPKDNDVFQVAKLSFRNGFNLRIKRLADNGYARPRVVQQVFVVGRLEEGVDLNGHGADLDCSKKTSCEIRRVEK